MRADRIRRSRAATANTRIQPTVPGRVAILMSEIKYPVWQGPSDRAYKKRDDYIRLNNEDKRKQLNSHRI